MILYTSDLIERFGLLWSFPPERSLLFIEASDDSYSIIDEIEIMGLNNGLIVLCSDSLLVK